MKEEKSKLFSRILMIVFFIIYYVPLASIIIFSFNEAKSVTHFTNFTFAWYKDLFTNERLLKIILDTFLIAIGATIISTIIGTVASICLTKTRRQTRSLLLGINNIPVMNPDIVIAIGLLLFFVTFSIERGYLTMLIAHISFCTPYVVINVYPKVKNLDPNIMEAALDLGAKPSKAIRSAIIPQITGAILSAAAISFTMSFDDFVISYFSGGSKLNISTYLYTEAKKINPTINALSTIIILLITGRVIYELILDKRKKVEVDD